MAEQDVAQIPKQTATEITTEAGAASDVPTDEAGTAPVLEVEPGVSLTLLDEGLRVTGGKSGAPRH